MVYYGLWYKSIYSTYSKSNENGRFRFTDVFNKYIITNFIIRRFNALDIVIDIRLQPGRVFTAIKSVYPFIWDEQKFVSLLMKETILLFLFDWQWWWYLRPQMGRSIKYTDKHESTDHLVSLYHPELGWYGPIMFVVGIFCKSNFHYCAHSCFI